MSDPFDVSSERILLTGASSGLGLHFARRLAKAGATLALAARSTDKLQALKAEIQAGGGTAHAIDMDVTDGASIRQGVDRKSVV